MSFASSPAGGASSLRLVAALKAVGQGHRTDLESTVERALFGEQGRAHPCRNPRCAFLDGNQELMIGGEPQDELAVERLCEARVGDGGRQATRGRSSAAFNASARRVPSDRSAIREPSRSARPLPIGRGGPRRADRRRRRRRADIVARSGRNREPRQSRPYARDRPRPPQPSRSYSAGRPGREVEGAGMRRASAPTRPARSMAKRTGRFWIATSCTTWS